MRQTFQYHHSNWPSMSSTNPVTPYQFWLTTFSNEPQAEGTLLRLSRALRVLSRKPVADSALSRPKHAAPRTTSPGSSGPENVSASRTPPSGVFDQARLPHPRAHAIVSV